MGNTHAYDPGIGPQSRWIRSAHSAARSPASTSTSRPRSTRESRTPTSLARRLPVPSAAMTRSTDSGPASVCTTTRSGPSSTSPTRQGARTSAPAARARSSSQWSSSVRVVIARKGSSETRSRCLPPRRVNDARVTGIRTGWPAGSAPVLGPISPPPQVL